MINKENAKKLLPILQAFIDGRAIQYKNVWNRWHDVRWCDVNNESTLPLGEIEHELDKYRIKPEPKYRPFKDAEECWQEMKNHQPFGYVIDKTTKLFSNIGMLDNRGILTLCTQYSCSLKESFNRYTFADGTPFGIKEVLDETLRATICDIR